MESFKKVNILSENIDKSDIKNKELILFLRNLADSIENDKLSSEQLQKTGEFFMSYKITEPEYNEEEYIDMDIIKFTTMGWYIYCILLDNDNKKLKDQSIIDNV